MPTQEQDGDPQEMEQGAWIAAELAAFAEGDRIRVTCRSTGAVDEGVVASTSCSTGEGDPALVVRTSDGVEACRHARYRTYERWVPAPSAWVPIEHDSLREGMYVRGTARHGANVSSVEGHVVAFRDGNMVRVDQTGRGFVRLDRRVWERRVAADAPTATTTITASDPVPAPEAGTWVVTPQRELVVGDRVRVVHRTGRWVFTGEVVSNGEYLDVLKDDGNEESFSETYRVFEKWVATTPATLTRALNPPQVGDRFTRVFNSPGILDRPGCIVRTVRERGDAPGQTLWLITYDDANGRYWDGELLVRPDGTCNPDVPVLGEPRDTTGMYVPEVPASTPAIPEYRWIPIRVGDIEQGMYVRGLPNREFAYSTPEGEVMGSNESFIYIGEIGAGYVRERTWERRVLADALDADQYAESTSTATGWVPVTDYAELNEGDVVRATPNGIGGRMQAVVTRSDRYSFSARTTHVIEESRNRRTSDLNWPDPHGYTYGDEPGVEAWRGVGSAPEPIDTTVPQETLDRPAFAPPQVGDTFTRTYDAAHRTAREGCMVEQVRPSDDGVGWRVRYRHGGQGSFHIGVLPNGRIALHPQGAFVLTEPAPSTVPTPHNPFAPTPSPAPQVREVPIPDWATSLEAARRHVHAQARRLYRSGDNCYGGSNDFVGGLDLPAVDAEFPAPVTQDESAQIREFLTKVREVALEVARDHGKSLTLVERWLNEQGIVEPPPAEVQHTVTFTAPADANVTQVLRDLGWQVQSNPFD